MASVIAHNTAAPYEALKHIRNHPQYSSRSVKEGGGGRAGPLSRLHSVRVWCCPLVGRTGPELGRRKYRETGKSKPHNG